jgi:folate-binding protein YgfZ
VVNRLGLFPSIPEEAFRFVTKDELYCMSHARGASAGFDLFIPTAAFDKVFQDSVAAAKGSDGRLCGSEALEMIRIEAGIPRFGVDMDETNLAPEAGIEARAISYSKGCYIGQEVISRIRTYGQVAKALRGLKLSAPAIRGEKLFVDGKEAGYITSALASPTFKANIALGYVRRDHNEAGTRLTTETKEKVATIVPLPFNARDLST